MAIPSIECIDFAKIDVEGSEWDIIDDLISSDSLKKFKQLIIEYHQAYHEDDKTTNFVDLLSEQGFEVTFRSSFNSKPFKCSLLHCFRH